MLSEPGEWNDAWTMVCVALELRGTGSGCIPQSWVVHCMRLLETNGGWSQCQRRGNHGMATGTRGEKSPPWSVTLCRTWMMSYMLQCELPLCATDVVLFGAGCWRPGAAGRCWYTGGARCTIRTLTLFFFFYYGIHSLMVEVHQNLRYLSW